MIRTASTLLLALWLAAALPGAAAGAPAEARPDSVAGDWSRAPEYRIVPGDKLTLNYGLNPASPRGFIDREVTVRPDGRITVFPVGDVVAAGRTTSELERAIVDLLAESEKAPRVVVEVTAMAGNEVHVLGEVSKPGSYPAGAYMTVLQAVTAAGGFTHGAARNSVLLFHRDGARNVWVERVAVDRMLKQGFLGGDRPVSRYDIVYVPRTAVGNLLAFTQDFFGPVGNALQTGLTGWELFNLDKVFFRNR